MPEQLAELATAFRRVCDALCALVSAIETRWEQDEPPLTDPAVRAAWLHYLRSATAARDLVFASAGWLPQLAAKHGRGEAGEWTEGAIHLLGFGLSVGPDQVPVPNIERIMEQVGERWGFLDRLRRYEFAGQPPQVPVDDFERQVDEQAELVRTTLRVFDAADVPPRGPNGEISADEDRLGWQMLTSGLVNNARVVPVELANRRLITAGIRPPGFQPVRWCELAVAVGLHPGMVNSADGIRRIAEAAVNHPLLPAHFRLPAPVEEQALPPDLPPVVPNSTQNEGIGPPQEPPPPDRFAGLREQARKELKGQERAVVEALCDAGGELALSALAVRDGLNWTEPDAQFKGVQRRLQGKNGKKWFKASWLLSRHDNTARLSAKEERKRS